MMVAFLSPGGNISSSGGILPHGTTSGGGTFHPGSSPEEPGKDLLGNAIHYL